MIDPNNIQKEVDQLYRLYYGKLVASLVSYFELSEINLAEDIVQDTFYAALRNWTKNGVPRQAAGWLFKVCKNKTINAIKREGAYHTRLSDHHLSPFPAQKVARLFLPHEIRDNQLRLLFATCHPALSVKAQIMLTLKTTIGFRTTEIARALHMEMDAVKKTLSRAKKRLKDQNIPFKVPYALQSKERINTVHRILYLIFNEGYSASSGVDLIRKELCLAAIRPLEALLGETKISDYDTEALYSLMLFNVARFESRIDKAGVPISLEDQDRSLWDHETIQIGIHYFNRARKKAAWSSYHYEAGIASLHCTAKHFNETPWNAILTLYEGLSAINDGALVFLNRYIALFYSGEREVAIEQVASLKGLEKNHLYFATLGKMHALQNHCEEALDFYLDALTLAKLEVEKCFIRQKITALKKLLS